MINGFLYTQASGVSGGGGGGGWFRWEGWYCGGGIYNYIILFVYCIIQAVKPNPGTHTLTRRIMKLINLIYTKPYSIVKAVEVVSQFRHIEVVLSSLAGRAKSCGDCGRDLKLYGGGDGGGGDGDGSNGGVTGVVVVVMVEWWWWGWW